jgi:membrane protein YqaA with SNARE-associated domain
MKIFAPLYEMTLKWAEHKHAPWFLGGMSFAESSFFPIPVDIMLAPMALQRPRRWAVFALIASVASVLGGLFGYMLGLVFWDVIQPYFAAWGWMPVYTSVAERINSEGVWILFIASFTPIPYKVATIAAGTLNMALLPFIFISLVGRSARFFLVAGLVAWAGPKIEPKIHQYTEWAGWACIFLIVAAYGLSKVL